jgi:type II secretory pathway component PulF
MPAYRFEALDAAGKSNTGLLEAENMKAARSQLRARALATRARVRENVRAANVW